MTEFPEVIRTVAELRARVAAARSEGKKIGLVPTMGALHHGHLSLVDVIAKQCDFIIVSIFVNPTQFGEGEDFEAYPRDEQTDLERLAPTAASLVYAPSVGEMYPDGDATTVSVRGLSSNFEGTHRPGHFEGVATVVSKLLLQSLPDAAIFGEKDFQQLAVIRRFVKDLAIPVTIIGGPIIREEDGLAASSRNVYLTPTSRAIAGKFNLTLKQLVGNVQAGMGLREAEAHATETLMTAGFDSVDYVSIVDPDTLKIMETLSRDARVLSVARLQKVRLLDNMAISAG